MLSKQLAVEPRELQRAAQEGKQSSKPLTRRGALPPSRLRPPYRPPLARARTRFRLLMGRNIKALASQEPAGKGMLVRRVAHTRTRFCLQEKGAFHAPALKPHDGLSGQCRHAGRGIKAPDASCRNTVQAAPPAPPGITISASSTFLPPHSAGSQGGRLAAGLVRQGAALAAAPDAQQGCTRHPRVQVSRPNRPDHSPTTATSRLPPSSERNPRSPPT